MKTRHNLASLTYIQKASDEDFHSSHKADLNDQPQGRAESDRVVENKNYN